MSKSMVFAFVVMMASVVLSAPPQVQIEAAEVAEPQELAPPSLAGVEAPGPQPRVTCDLLSGIGWGHSFCAAHCLAQGFKGGSCNNNGVCVCRN